MTREVQFIKIGPYETQPANTDIFDYITELCAQRINPPSIKPQGLVVKADHVFHSPLRRAVESFLLKDNALYFPLQELKEIPFEFGALCTRQEWYKYGSSSVRRTFKQGFISDALLIPRSTILNEVELVIESCRQVVLEKTVSVISHSFRLKVIQAYLETNGRIVRNPESINEFIKDEERTFDFGQGFTYRL